MSPWCRALVRTLLGRRSERGYAALLVAILTPVVFIGCAAISVDTARWYVEGQKAQRAADAAALAGVVWMPSDIGSATSTALAVAKQNGFDTASSAVQVTVVAGDKPSQLMVTVTSTISNSFGAAIGTPKTTISRSSTADYAGGLSMGSPCDVFGSDPETSSAVSSAACSDVGNFWANDGSRPVNSGSGDAFQNSTCSFEDHCSGGVNSDYDPNGYLYTVSFSQAVSNARLEAFDPSMIAVGDACDSSNLDGASSITQRNTLDGNPSTRYVAGFGPYCTGDKDFTGNSSSGFANQESTNYTVRMQGADSDPTRPATWPVLDTSTCPGAKTYPGYDGPLGKLLDTSTADYRANPDVAQTFRRWVPLCTASYVPAGTTIAVQVRSNGLGTDAAGGHNRFSLRAYSTSSPSSNASISIAAFNKMAVYANVKNGLSKFYLTRLPSSTAGQTLTINLFDIGDIGFATATITFLAPAESGTTFSNCRGSGNINGPIADCKIKVDSSFNGKWQTVYIPIPKTYRCTDSSSTGCWVKLNYDLSNASNPGDTTSWQTAIDGQPVRLIN